MKPTGQQLKERGQRKVYYPNQKWVHRMRDIAEMLSRTRALHRGSGEISADDLRGHASRLPPPKSPNAWGVIFKGPHWKHVGYVASRHPSNHHRTIKVWHYEP